MSKGQGSQLEGAKAVTTEDQHNGSIQDSGTETPRKAPPTYTNGGRIASPESRSFASCFARLSAARDSCPVVVA